MGTVTVPLKGESPKTADLVVIGGGIAGVSSGFFCSWAGLKTVVVEKREDLGRLTTSASTECFRAQFESHENIDLMLGSIEIFHHFRDVVKVADADIALHPQGYIYVTGDPAQAAAYRETVANQHQLGLADVELLSGDEARARFPYLGPRVIAARYRAGDGWLSVHEMLWGFAKGSQAQHFLQTQVLGILVDSQGVCGVQTSRGVIQTRRVVVAAGPFSGQVARLAGVELPLTILRRHRLAVLHCDLVPTTAPFTMDDDTGVYWRPEAGGALIGKAFETEPEGPQDVVPTDYAFPAMVLDPESPCAAGLTAPFWNQATGIMTRTNLNLTAGQYTYTPDHMPIIGHCADVPGLYVNTGYSGHGIMGGPEGGRRLARLITDHNSEALNPFSLERFRGAGAAWSAKEKVY